MGHLLHIGNDKLGIEADGVRALQLLQCASEQVPASAQGDIVEVTVLESTSMYSIALYEVSGIAVHC